jgi:hypothetical protein
MPPCLARGGGVDDRDAPAHHFTGVGEAVGAGGPAVGAGDVVDGRMPNWLNGQ